MPGLAEEGGAVPGCTVHGQNTLEASPLCELFQVGSGHDRTLWQRVPSMPSNRSNHG